MIGKAFPKFQYDASIIEIACVSTDGELWSVCRSTPINEQKTNKQLTQWLDLTMSDIHCIGSWCIHQGFKRLAVYSYGHTKGKRTRDMIEYLLIREIVADARIKLAYIITETMTTLAGAHNIRLADIDRLDDVDAIIVTNQEQIYDLSCIFEQKTAAKLVSINDILYHIYEEYTQVRALANELYKLKMRRVKTLLVLSLNGYAIENPSEWEQ